MVSLPLGAQLSRQKNKNKQDHIYPRPHFHLKITSLDVNEALNRFEEFLADPKAELFVFVSHGYDFEFGQTYGALEQLCKRVEESGVRSIYTSELPAFMNQNRR